MHRPITHTLHITRIISIRYTNLFIQSNINFTYMGSVVILSNIKKKKFFIRIKLPDLRSE